MHGQRYGIHSSTSHKYTLRMVEVKYRDHKSDSWTWYRDVSPITLRKIILFLGRPVQNPLARLAPAGPVPSIPSELLSAPSKIIKTFRIVVRKVSFPQAGTVQALSFPDRPPAGSARSPVGVVERGEVVQTVCRLAEGLACHDVDVLRQEHPAAVALAHRLDKGVLDLGESPALHDGLLVTHRLRSLDEEVGIVSGEDAVVQHDAAVLLVHLRRLLEAGGGGGVVALATGLFPPLLLTDAEGAVVVVAEGAATHIHPDDPGVERGTDRLKHRGDDGVGEVRVGVVLAAHAVDRPEHLVGHGQVVVLLHVVEGATKLLLVLNIDAVGLTVRHDHERRNLNVVVPHPLLHELTDEHDALHRGGATHRDGTATTGLTAVGGVQSRKNLLPHFPAVTGRGEVYQLRTVDLDGVGVLGGDLRIGVVHETLTPRIVRVGLDVFLAGGFTARVERTGHIREGEHLNRNLRLLAEPHQLHHLKDAILQDRPHRTGEVDHKDDPVVLAVLLDDLRQEDVIGGAVLMEAVKVQVPRLLGALLANLVRCLAALKLRHQLTDERIGLPDELSVVVDDAVAVVNATQTHDLMHLVRADDLILVIGQGRDDERGSVVGFPGLATDALTDILQAIHALAGNHLIALIAVLVALTGSELLLHLLNLVTQRLVVAVAEALGEGDHLLKGFDRKNLVHDLLLHLVKIDRHEAGNAPLHVEVDPGERPRLVHVHLGELKEIGVHDLLVAQEEVTAGSGVLLLHQTLDADILDDIGDALHRLGAVALGLGLTQQTIRCLVVGPQSVADLMGDQHGLKHRGDIPHGHDEVPILHIERSGLGVGVERERNVLGGERTGKDGERLVHGLILPYGRREMQELRKIFLIPITGRRSGGLAVQSYYPGPSEQIIILRALG